MFTKRIIPCLDVKDGRVVKGVNFVDLRDAGDPVEIAAAYDKAGADEVVFLDITASSDHRNTVVDMVRRVAEQVFIPFTVGGGIRTVEVTLHVGEFRKVFEYVPLILTFADRNYPTCLMIPFQCKGMVATNGRNTLQEQFDIKNRIKARLK